MKFILQDLSPVIISYVLISLVIASMSALVSFPSHPIKLTSIYSEYVGKSIKINNKLKFDWFPYSHITYNRTIWHNKLCLPKKRIDYDIKDRLENYSVYFYNYEVDQNIVVFENIYYSSANAYIVNGTDYYIHYLHLHQNNYKVVKELRTAVSLCSAYADCYGDFMSGQLVSLQILPKELLDIGPFIINTRYFRHYYEEMWNLNGLRPKEIYFLYFRDAIYVEKLYTIFPWVKKSPNEPSYPYMYHFIGPLYTKYSNNIRKLFDCDKIEPYEYTFYNRDVKHTRSFSNYKEIHSQLIKNFPEKNIQFFEGNIKSFRETVHRHAIIRWYFSFTGSNCVNLLFMKEGMSALIAMPINYYDIPVMCPIYSRCLKVITFQTSAGWHHGGAIKGNISRIIHYVNISFNNEFPIYDTC